MADIVPDLIESSSTAWRLPEAMDPELKRLYGDKIALWGGLGSQSTIPGRRRPSRPRSSVSVGVGWRWLHPGAGQSLQAGDFYRERRCRGGGLRPKQELSAGSVSGDVGPRGGLTGHLWLS